MPDQQKTIGILTFHTPVNYGAILQAYALQKYLKSEYPDASIENIDFNTIEHQRKYRIFLPFRKNILKYAYYQFCILLRYSQLKERKKKFRAFLSEEFTLTKRFASVEDLVNNPPPETHYIVGSDQVFHPRSLYLKAYYLGFNKGSARKIAYAPSFGMSDFTQEVEQKTKAYLQDFDALSCRENDGAEFLSKVVGIGVQRVVDPIFLLSKQEWREMAVEPVSKQKYIFIYDLNGGDNLIKIAQQIKSYTGYDIVCQTQTAHKAYDVDKQFYDLGPREFIGYMLNAEYVVTDSFHGIAFSILFQKKQFAYIARPKAASRIESVMSLINGEKRILSESNSLTISKEDILINYDTENLRMMIDESKKYLNKSISK